MLLPGGKVLLLASAPHVTYKRDAHGNKTAIDTFTISPQSVLLYDPVTNAVPAALAPQPSTANDRGKLLLRPTGQVLYSCKTAGELELLTLDATVGADEAAWKPIIDNCPARMMAGRTYTISGRKFNGPSQACSFGDDAQMATNFPIVRLTDAAGQVFYARTFDFSTLAVATGASPVSALVQVPAAVRPGPTPWW